jgi:hypothetical protein
MALNYDHLPDAGFRKQYDVTPRDAEVEALLSGVEPPLVAREVAPPRIQINTPAPQFRWLKPLG